MPFMIVIVFFTLMVMVELSGVRNAEAFLRDT
jgi:hypothetical protein